jgi:hypothetical protein
MSYNKCNSKKPFCKVCHDAGKPESDYTGHHVRSLPDKQGNTKVTCPTLLNTECRYCYELGHTAKFCPAIAKRQKAEDRHHREEIRTAKQPVQKPKVDLRGGRFNVLLSDDEEEEVVKVEEYPALSQRVTNSYATAARQAQVATQVAGAKQSQVAALPAGFVVLQKGATYEKKKVPSKSWADYDSDDDSDDETSAW